MLTGRMDPVRAGGAGQRRRGDGEEELGAVAQADDLRLRGFSLMEAGTVGNGAYSSWDV